MEETNKNQGAQYKFEFTLFVSFLASFSTAYPLLNMSTHLYDEETLNLSSVSRAKDLRLQPN